MNPFISVIVPSRGRLQKLHRLLDCLAQQALGSDDRFEVVVGLDGHDAANADRLPIDDRPLRRASGAVDLGDFVLEEVDVR